MSFWANYKWYRRKKGGIWFQVRKEVPKDAYDYPYKMWVNERPKEGIQILSIENYEQRIIAKE